MSYYEDDPVGFDDMLTGAYMLRTQVEEEYAGQKDAHKQNSDVGELLYNLKEKQKNKLGEGDEASFAALQDLAARAVKRNTNKDGTVGKAVLDLEPSDEWLSDPDDNFSFVSSKKGEERQWKIIGKNRKGSDRVSDYRYIIKSDKGDELTKLSPTDEDGIKAEDLISNNFMMKLNSFVESTGGKFVFGPQKGRDRCFEKVKKEYDNDWEALCDLERGTGVYKDPKSMAQALSVLIKNEPGLGFKVVRCYVST